MLAGEHRLTCLRLQLIGIVPARVDGSVVCPAGDQGLEVCPGREASSETALQSEWTDINGVAGVCTHACLRA